MKWRWREKLSSSFEKGKLYSFDGGWELYSSKSSFIHLYCHARTSGKTLISVFPRTFFPQHPYMEVLQLFDVLLEEHQSHWKFLVTEWVSSLFYTYLEKLNQIDAKESNSELSKRLDQHVVKTSTPNDILCCFIN